MWYFREFHVILYPMLRACVLTVVLEAIVFLALGARTLREHQILCLVNILTNLSLNLLLQLQPALYGYILLLELLVVLIEYLLLKGELGQGFSLLWKVAAALAFSYFIGTPLHEWCEFFFHSGL